LFNLWRAQYTFFRRYGIEDEKVVTLTGVLLFVLLIFVYPLEFIMATMTNKLLGVIGVFDRGGGSVGQGAARVCRDRADARERGRGRAVAPHANEAARGVAAATRRAGALMRMSPAAFVGLATLASACGKSSPPSRSVETAASNRTEAPAPAGDGACPATGYWAKCSVLYRLERAGLAPHLDSAATPDEKSLSGSGSSFVVKIGSLARLEVFLYPDSATRISDEKKLDKSKLVAATAPQTILRERTLIENANLVGLLTSINGHQRERVSDALTAGPPQPPSR
jgi:hypothetical protein